MGFTRKFIGALGIEGEKVDELITAHNEVVEGLKTERDKLKADLDTANAEAARLRGDADRLKQLQADFAALKTENGQLQEAKKGLERLQADYDALKATAEQYKTEADKLPGVQEALTALRDSSAKEADELKSQLETVKKEYDGYKQEQTTKETASKKRSAYRAMLKEIGVGAEWTDDIMKIADINGLTLDEDGKLSDLDALKKDATAKYGRFIEVSGKQGASVTNPPKTTNVKMTREEIYRKDDKGRYIHDTAERQKALTELLEQGE